MHLKEKLAIHMRHINVPASSHRAFVVRDFAMALHKFDKAHLFRFSHALANLPKFKSPVSYSSAREMSALARLIDANDREFEQAVIHSFNRSVALSPRINILMGTALEAYSAIEKYAICPAKYAAGKFATYAHALRDVPLLAKSFFATGLLAISLTFSSIRTADTAEYSHGQIRQEQVVATNGGAASAPAAQTPAAQMPSAVAAPSAAEPSETISDAIAPEPATMPIATERGNSATVENALTFEEVASHPWTARSIALLAKPGESEATLREYLRCRWGTISARAAKIITSKRHSPKATPDGIYSICAMMELCERAFGVKADHQAPFIFKESGFYPFFNSKNGVGLGQNTSSSSVQYGLSERYRSFIIRRVGYFNSSWFATSSGTRLVPYFGAKFGGSARQEFANDPALQMVHANLTILGKGYRTGADILRIASNYNGSSNRENYASHYARLVSSGIFSVGIKVQPTREIAPAKNAALFEAQTPLRHGKIADAVQARPDSAAAQQPQAEILNAAQMPLDSDNGMPNEEEILKEMRGGFKK